MSNALQAAPAGASDIWEAARRACAEHGIIFRDVPADGKPHVADLADGRHGKGDGQVLVFPDLKGGWVANFHNGREVVQFWADAPGRPPSEEERAERDKRKAATQAKADADNAAAAKRAEAVIRAAIPTDPRTRT